MDEEKKARREQRRQKIRDAYNGKKAEVIPAKPELSLKRENKREKVGAYCRVSTPQESQAESFEIQQAQYREYVAGHQNWELVDIYADEGISATSMKHREDFLRLIEDCKAGKVTLIVTKAVSRFARNVVDCVSICRMLKNLDPPVGVFFETEGIHTLSDNSEMVLSMLAAVAQGESDVKSTSMKWAIRNRFANSIPRMVDLYGFDREGEELTPNDKAEVVKKMYQIIADGGGVSDVLNYLEEKMIPSPTGKERWSRTSVMYILTNERYNGDVVMQKTLTVDLFSHKAIKNRGQIPKYIYRDHHDGIVSKQQWLRVQWRLGTAPPRKLYGEEITEGRLKGFMPVITAGAEREETTDEISYG